MCICKHDFKPRYSRKAKTATCSIHELTRSSAAHGYHTCIRIAAVSVTFYCCLSMCTASILVRWNWKVSAEGTLHFLKGAPIDIIPIPTVFIPLQHLVYWRAACGEPLLVQPTHTIMHSQCRT